MTAAQAILTALERVHPYLEPEEALWMDVNLTLPQRIKISDLRQELDRLEVERKVVSIRDELTHCSKYRITDLGRALLRS